MREFLRPGNQLAADIGVGECPTALHTGPSGTDGSAATGKRSPPTRLPIERPGRGVKARRNRYLGLALSAAFSTAAPVALTSLPAPSTVLQPHNVARNAAASNAHNVFIVIPHSRKLKRPNNSQTQATSMPLLRRYPPLCDSTQNNPQLLGHCATHESRRRYAPVARSGDCNQSGVVTLLKSSIAPQSK
jgi:hypothetical protein